MNKNSEIQNLHSKTCNRKYKIVVIGVSAGGLNAIKTVLLRLPSDLPLEEIGSFLGNLKLET